MRASDFLGRLRGKNKIAQGEIRPSANSNARKEIKGLISYFHIVALKVLRDREPAVRLVVPRDGEANIMITVQLVPKGMQPAQDYFVMEPQALEHGLKAVTFNPTEAQISEILGNE